MKLLKHINFLLKQIDEFVLVSSFEYLDLYRNEMHKVEILKKYNFFELGNFKVSFLIFVYDVSISIYQRSEKLQRELFFFLMRV